MGIRKIVLFIAMLAVVLVPQDAQARRRRVVSQKSHRAVPALVNRSAGYADIVIDAETGEIIHETNSEGIRHPASLTKMMTLYLTFQALDAGRMRFGQYVSVSKNASKQAPSKLGLKPGQRIRVEDLVLGLVTESANDAAVVLAEAMGGSEANFARMMTRQARALGMARTQFRNPSGLPDPNQVTTARDMAILGVALINHFPRYYPYFSQESFNYGGRSFRNHNRLMSRYDGMDGIKTGYIRASGFNLVASAKRDGKRLIAVVFGGRSAVSRDNLMAGLLDRSFDFMLARGNRSQRVASAQTKPSFQPPMTTQAQIDAADADDKGYDPSSTADRQPRSNVVVAEGDAEDLASLAPASGRAYSEAKPSRAGGGTWGVQIGAYSNPDVGRQVLASLVSSMSRLPVTPDPQVQKVNAGGVVMYRARLMALDKRTAQDVCANLNQRGESCITVQQ